MGAGPHLARIWGCDPAAEAQFDATQQPSTWQWHEGFAGSLDLHTSRIFRLGLSSKYLITADDAGWCRTWDKLKSYICRAARRLHSDGSDLADITSDRHFLYSVGAIDLSVRIWSLPDLKPVMTLSADIPFVPSWIAPPHTPLSPGLPRDHPKDKVEVTAKVE